MSAKIVSFDEVKLPNTVNSQEKPEREPTVFWLNVGVKRGDKLVQLPMGIPLDRLQAKKIPSSSTKNPEFRNLRLAEADLWTKVQKVMESLKPGESVELPMTVELRRVEEAQTEQTEAEASENPFLVGSLF